MKTTRALFGTLSITMALAVQVQAQSFLTNGLVAYYPFNGNANDASGSGNNAIFVGGVQNASDRFGGSGMAAFVATNGVIKLPSTSAFQTSATTFAFWFETETNILTDDPANFVCVLLNSSASHTPLMYVNSNKFSVHNPPQAMDVGYYWAGYVTANYQMPIAQWTHFCLVIDGTSRIIYVNGSQIFQANDYFGNAAYPVTEIGNYSTDPNTHSARGAFDDVRIYNRALSASEVQQLYVYESGPRVNLVKAVKPSFSNLILNTNYQLQVSADLKTWTNQGSPFMATNTSMGYPQYWDVDNWNSLYFRLRVTP